MVVGAGWPLRWRLLISNALSFAQRSDNDVAGIATLEEVRHRLIKSDVV